MKKHFTAALRLVDPFAVASIIVPLFVHLLTLAPSVTFFDSGEFVTAIHSLGSAHSPGYPLFINYAKPFTYLPFGSIAFRVNVATALSAAFACFGVYLLTAHFLAREETADVRGLNDFFRKAVSLSAALTFAFSDRLWLQSNHDKPYPIISFLAAMIFYLILLWRDSHRRGVERPAYLYLGAFFCGLAFAAHQTMVLLIPSFIFLILAMDWRLVFRVREIILIASFALVGFSVHLHLPVRATKNPLLNWGDPDTLSQFLWHFLRRGYPVEKPDRELSLFWAQLKAFNIPNEFNVIGLTLLLIGIYMYRRKLRDEILAYAIGAIFFLSVIIGYLNAQPDLIFLTEEFFTPLYLLTAVFIGLGSYFLIEKLAVMLRETIGTITMRGVVFITIFALPSTLFALNHWENDQHENYIAYDYSVNTLLPLPENSILFTWGDSGAFPLWYMQGVEKMREDLSIVHSSHLYFPWYLDTFPDLFKEGTFRETNLKGKTPEFLLGLVIAEQVDKRPVYIDYSTRYSTHLAAYALHQEGICYRVERNLQAAPLMPDLAVWDLFSLRGTDGGLFKMDLDTTKAILIYAYSRMEGGETLIRLGHKREGTEQLLIAEKMAPVLKPQIDNMLGVNKQNKKSD